MKTLLTCLAAMLWFLVSLFSASFCAAQTSAEGAIVINSNKSFTFTNIAVQNLKLLREVVTEMNAQEHLLTLQAIMMVETQAGTGGSIGLPRAHPNRRSYGWMQLTIPTARVLFRDNDNLRVQYFGERVLKSVKDKEIMQLLLTDHKLNVRMGIMLYTMYFDMVKHQWARTVAAYNMGIGNAMNRPNAPKSIYVTKVRHWLPILKILNKKIEESQTITTVSVDYYSTLPDNWLGIKGQLQGEQYGQEQKETTKTIARSKCNKRC
jgi:hypothetical protein